MKCPSAPIDDECKRLDALYRYRVLDTLPERALDELTELVSQICEVPTALISLVDEHRQWFKSRVGESSSETPREVSFCAHALRLDDLLVVPDATRDERFAKNPFPILRKLNPDLPLVAASGYTPSERGGHPTGGVQHFLSKPYTAETLLRVMQQVLAG